MYLARRQMNVSGKMLTGCGEPVPDDAVTPSLISMSWITAATPEEEKAALAEFGAPPEGVLQLGWEYGPKGKKPRVKKPRKKKAAPKKKAAASSAPAPAKKKTASKRTKKKKTASKRRGPALRRGLREPTKG